MVLIKIKSMARRGQIRKAVKYSYHFLQDRYTRVSEPDDVKFFREQDNNSNIYDIVEEGTKEAAKKVEQAKANPSAKAGITKDEAYALSKEQQEKVIKEQLGHDPKNFRTEAERVKFIVESLGGN